MAVPMQAENGDAGSLRAEMNPHDGPQFNQLVSAPHDDDTSLAEALLQKMDFDTPSLPRALPTAADEGEHTLNQP